MQTHVFYIYAFNGYSNVNQVQCPNLLLDKSWIGKRGRYTYILRYIINKYG